MEVYHALYKNNQQHQNVHTAKAIYRFNAISMKIAMTFFTELEQIRLKSVWNHKTLSSHGDLEKKNKVRGIVREDIKLYYKSTVIKTA